MTSKKLSLADIAINIKRRNWLIVISFLVFFFTIPVPVISQLSFEASLNAAARNDFSLGVAFSNYITPGVSTGLLVIIMAIVSAIQGFSYMYKRTKLDFYMSVPVGKESRFFAIYINGFLICTIALIINLLITFPPAGAMGADISYALKVLPIALASYILLFFAVYNTTILAVMLTGHMAVSILGTIVFLFIDGLYIGVIESYMGIFFKSYFDSYLTENFSNMVVSPVLRYLTGVSELYKPVVDGAGLLYFVPTEFIRLFSVIFVFGLAALVLAFYAYCKKPSESAGKAMAFGWTKPVVKIAVSIVISMSFGLIMYETSGSQFSFMVFGLIAGLLLCHGFMEAVYEFDLKAVLKGGRSLLITLGAVFVIMLIFVADITGYDQYVPTQDQVESVSVFFTDEWNQIYYDDNMNEVRRDKYLRENMRITNTAPVLELAALRMGQDMKDFNLPKEEYDKYVESGANYTSTLISDGPTAVFIAGKLAAGANEDIRTLPNRRMVIGYNLKNGKTVYRCINSLYLEDWKLLDEIIRDDDYKKTAYNVYNDKFIESFKSKNPSIYITNDLGEIKANEISLDEFVACYRKDMEGFGFSTVLNELPCASVRVNSDDPMSYIYSNYTVYPSFTNTMELLGKEKAYLDKEEQISLVDHISILKISNDDNVSTYPYPAVADAYAYETIESDSDSQALAEIKDPAKIKELYPALWSTAYVNTFIPEHLTDNTLDVRVFFKPGTNPDSSFYYGEYYPMKVVKSKAPAFLQSITQ